MTFACLIANHLKTIGECVFFLFVCSLLSTKRPLVPDESVQVTWTENTTENFFDDRQKATSIFPAHRAPNLCRPDLPSVVRLKSLHDRMEADAKA